MKWRLLLLTTLLTLFCTSAFTSPTAAGDDLLTHEIRADLEKSLDLWRNERYGELYSRVTDNSHTKEYFISHLTTAPRKPSCCWDKLQELRVSERNERLATIHGKFGFDTVTGVEFMTKGLKLEKDDGIWKIKMTDLLSLSGKGKKIKSGKKKVP
jgi:hypothetical protein